MIGNKETLQNIHIAVIGKSAAGKSAFIKSFSNFPELINSEGEGQTTRSYAEYTFLVKEDNVIPKASIKLMTKDEFVNFRSSQAFDKIKYLNKGQGISFDWLDEQYEDESYKEEIDTIIIYADDFFNIQEFNFLSNGKCVDKIIELYQELVQVITFLADRDSGTLGITKFTETNKENLENILRKYHDKELIEDDGDSMESREEALFENMLKIFYDQIYDIIIELIKDNYLSSGILYEKNNILSFEFEIAENYQDILGLFLKVVKEDDDSKKSFTGIISKVQITSRISDEYLPILKKLNIQNIVLVDTYGLDHDKQLAEKVLIGRYQRIFNVDYPNISTVFFIEALHRGASNDFINAIKILYSQRPDIMTYIVGTYIDDHDENTLNKNSEWLLSLDKYSEDTQVPDLNGKAIDFLYKKPDILNTLKRNNVYPTLAQKRIEVMRKRFGAFCGKISLGDPKVNLLKDINIITITAIFDSIVQKEHLGDGYINIDKIFRILEQNANIERILKYMIEVSTQRFEEIFSSAGPRTKWRIRTNLQKYKLGFTGSTLDATWFRVFNDAYNETFTKQIKLDKKVTYLSHEFECEGNEKIAFDELLNTYFPYLFAKKCEKGDSLNCWEHEVSCYRCAKLGGFDNKCLWGILINLVDKDNFNKSHMYNTVLGWLCDIHNLSEKGEEAFYQQLKEIFTQNMRQQFIPLCRQHNARIASRYVKKETEDYISAKKKVLEEYKANYDNNVDSNEFVSLMNR